MSRTMHGESYLPSLQGSLQLKGLRSSRALGTHPAAPWRLHHWFRWVFDRRNIHEAGQTSRWRSTYNISCTLERFTLTFFFQVEVAPPPAPHGGVSAQSQPTAWTLALSAHQAPLKVKGPGVPSYFVSSASSRHRPLATCLDPFSRLRPPPVLLSSSCPSSIALLPAPPQVATFGFPPPGSASGPASFCPASISPPF